MSSCFSAFRFFLLPTFLSYILVQTCSFFVSNLLFLFYFIFKCILYCNLMKLFYCFRHSSNFSIYCLILFLLLCLIFQGAEHLACFQKDLSRGWGPGSLEGLGSKCPASCPGEYGRYAWCSTLNVLPVEYILLLILMCIFKYVNK